MCRFLKKNFMFTSQRDKDVVSNWANDYLTKCASLHTLDTLQGEGGEEDTDVESDEDVGDSDARGGDVDMDTDTSTAVADDAGGVAVAAGGNADSVMGDADDQHADTSTATLYPSIQRVIDHLDGISVAPINTTCAGTGRGPPASKESLMACLNAVTAHISRIECLKNVPSTPSPPSSSIDRSSAMLTNAFAWSMFEPPALELEKLCAALQMECLEYVASYPIQFTY